MRNPLQEQLLKAGLVKKDKVAKVVRDQAKQRQGKAPTPADVEQVDTRKLQAERAERDRRLAAERNADARAKEIGAQVRQIVQTTRMPHDGDIAYRFTDGATIATVLVNEAVRNQLASGMAAIARIDGGYALIPRASADKIHARAPEAIVLDHGRPTEGPSTPGDDDDHYKQFVVPDDLIW